MSSQRSNSSIPLTAQHQAEREPESGFGWESKYKRLGSLGSGGGAEVFEVVDKRTGEHVALKVSKWSGEDLLRFRREVSVLRNLSHENIIPVLDDGDNWYTMPLAVGNLTSLAPEMCDEALLEMMTQVAKGLAAAHAERVIHRDVTPNNILRVEQRWVISDFGLAKRPKGLSGVPTTQGFAGTHGYAAPEVEIYGADRADQHAPS